MTKRRLILFIIFVIALGYFTFLLIPLLGLNYGAGSSIIILAVGMFVPTISSFLVRLITKEGFQNLYLKPNLRANGKFYIAIYFVPTLLLLLSAVLYFLILPNSFDSDFTLLKSVSPNKNVAVIMAIAIAQVLVIGPIVNIIPTLGEEIGWRGYLLPKLRELMSDRKAIIVSGIIWGIWHAPVIVLGHNYEKDYMGYPYLGIIAMVLFCVMLSIIESYTFFKTSSVIPAAMIHSTVNAGAALPIMVAQSGYNTLLGPAITGVVGAIPFIVVSLVIFIKIGKKTT